MWQERGCRTLRSMTTETKFPAARQVMGLRGVPRPILWATAIASYAGVALSAVNGWPGWAYVVVVVAMWAPVVFMETAWMYRHFGWIALFYVLVITQGGHLLEHVAQMVQLHVMGRRGPDARGVVGALDVEWVHLGFNTWVFIALLTLLVRFRRNPWMWVTLAAAVWHQAEHTYIISVFLSTGVEGTPGLLAMGGRLWGGLDVTRPDLHFFYNVGETVPLVVAFVWQLRRTYSTWLARAFSQLSDADLATLARETQLEQRQAGSVLVRQADLADDLYILARGEAEVWRDGRASRYPIATLRPGQVFGEAALAADGVRAATVRARTPVEYVRINGAAARELLAEAASS